MKPPPNNVQDVDPETVLIGPFKCFRKARETPLGMNFLRTGPDR